MDKNSNATLIIENVSKSYKPALSKALSEVSFSVKRGNIHAIVGENAAGKSTLMKIIAGLLKPDDGEVFFNGKKLVYGVPKYAHKVGIELVEQNFRIAETLTIAENIFLGNEPGKLFLFDKKKAVQATSDLSEKYGIKINPMLPGKMLTTGEKQAVEILRALSRDPDLLILDEPTSVLTDDEVENLLKTILSLKKNGKTIIFVSHKLKEVTRIADEITVLRKGKVVGDLSVPKLSEKKIAVLMTGQEPVSSKFKVGESLDTVLEIKDLTTKDYLIKNISLESKRGEILGIAGIKGNGQETLMDAIFGLNEILSGSIRLCNKEISGFKTGEIRKHGVAYIPSDRYNTGSCKESSILENFIPYRIRNSFLINKERVKVLKNWTLSSLKENEITYNSINDNLDSLSGGNLQKLLIARETSEALELLLLNEPTQGLDIRAANYVYRKLEDLKNRTAVIMVSSDLDEILEISDRILVMYRGQIVFNRRNISITKKILADYIMGLKKATANTEEII